MSSMSELDIELTERGYKALTQDMIHVLLDAVGQVETLVEAHPPLAKTYSDAYGGEEADDPKTTPEGWVDQLQKARKTLETALDHGWTLGNAGIL